jgi:hypothetical protein
VVPELFVPVVKGFECEELAGFQDDAIWECPIVPKEEVNTVQSETRPEFFGIQLEVPRVNLLSKAFELREGEYCQTHWVVKMITEVFV